jgi:hypothetical protein
VVHVDYDALDPVINFKIPDECDTLSIGMLTGDLQLNLIDPAGNSGDYLKVLLIVDGVAPRTVTIGGPQGAPGVAVLAVGVAVLFLVYHDGIGQYASVVAP